LVDFLSRAERSERMSRIRSTNTLPEVVVRRALHASGFRFRLHCKELPGKPDIVLPRHKTVVLVHGCFWHRHHDCKIATNPKSNSDFWRKKFDRNVARDAHCREQLEARGWRVIVVWECELGSIRKTAEAMLRITSEISDSREGM